MRNDLGWIVSVCALGAWSTFLGVSANGEEPEAAVRQVIDEGQEAARQLGGCLSDSCNAARVRYARRIETLVEQMSVDDAAAGLDLAALSYIQVASPLDIGETEPGTLIRPRREWSDFVRVAEKKMQLINRGLAEQQANILLLRIGPLYLGTGKLLGRCYTEEYVRPFMEMHEMRGSGGARALAGGIVAIQMMRLDWMRAVALSEEIYEMEKQGDTSSAEEIDYLRTSAELMKTAFMRELDEFSELLAEGLERYRAAHGGYPSDEVMLDPNGLWGVAEPYLQQVAGERGEMWLEGGGDLGSNRLLTVPGLRVRSLERTSSGNNERVRLDMVFVFWDGVTLEGPEDIREEPWLVRYTERMKALPSESMEKGRRKRSERR